jgi:hypothetical protein
VRALVGDPEFWAIPVGDFGARGINVISPFLFGVIEVTTTTPAG